VGKITDKGITDTNNMGAAMAPAAFETLKAHFSDTGRSPSSYDMIFTGDLGTLGSELLVELLRKDGIQLNNHADCGAMLFDREHQDVHCGGSGCGCCASVLTGHILNHLKAGKWKNVLFCPTGALHSPTSAFQGESIPGICHAIAISTTK
jgi:stage V sporulation protein AD